MFGWRGAQGKDGATGQFHKRIVLQAAAAAFGQAAQLPALRGSALADSGAHTAHRRLTACKVEPVFVSKTTRFTCLAWPGVAAMLRNASRCGMSLAL